MELEEKKTQLTQKAPHIFTFWNELTTTQKQSLIEQAETIDFNHIKKLYTTHAQQEDFDFTPPTIRTRLDFTQQTKNKGEQALKEGKVAIFIVAGGDGSRLGFKGPKGLYPASKLTKKTLFEIFCEQLHHLQIRYGHQAPLYIMTSDNNHQETAQYFKDNNYFGINKPYIFKQSMLPVLDHQGKVILSNTSKILLAPSGTGGIYEALNNSGAIQEMKTKGIEYLYYIQVDNPLARFADPHFIGAHIETNSEFSTKVVEKSYPEEQVGLIVNWQGKERMCEYIHLPEHKANQRDKDGKLSYRAANIAIHIINVNFITTIHKNHTLPYFLAKKKVEHIDENGEHITPLEPNAYKFESFVFDTMPHAQKTLCYEVSRQEEFAPIKNATGKDSPQSAHAHMTRLYKDWLASIGIHKSTLEKLEHIEISPRLAIDKESFTQRAKHHAKHIRTAAQKRKNLYLN